MLFGPKYSPTPTATEPRSSSTTSNIAVVEVSGQEQSARKRGIRYRAFGKRFTLSGSNPARRDPSFQNRTYDAGLGIYDYRNRSFDPATGRFLQRDPVLDGNNLYNPYAAMGNNPVGNVDPMGTLVLPVSTWKVFKQWNTKYKWGLSKQQLELLKTTVQKAVDEVRSDVLTWFTTTFSEKQHGKWRKEVFGTAKKWKDIKAIVKMITPWLKSGKGPILISNATQIEWAKGQAAVKKLTVGSVFAPAYPHHQLKGAKTLDVVLEGHNLSLTLQLRARGELLTISRRRYTQRRRPPRLWFICAQRSDSQRRSE